MSDRPLVSVVCGTWQRHDLLMEAIENVRQQTYRPLEHVIVSDGPDPELREALEAICCDYLDRRPHRAESGEVPIIFAECGRNWTGFLTNSRNAVPWLVADWLARGDIIAWLADDERFLVPDYLERMVGILEETGVDFVYPNVAVYWKGQPVESAYPIGSDPPRCGSVTHAVHRASLLDVPGGGFRTHVGSSSDWDQFERWLQAGKTWKHIPETLVNHRIDG